MSDEETMDVIVVGAGLAGLACACEAAEAGLQVIVLERGDSAGDKNITGGRLYLEPLRELCPGLIAGAPFERPVVSENIVLCDEETGLSLRSARRTAGERPNSVTVLRTRLDAHLAEQATAKGAMLLPQQRAEGLIEHDGRVLGVRVGPEEIEARAVVAADGALSFMAEQAGLRTGRDPRSLALGIKEIIRLEAGSIEERFNLAPGQGAARLYVGHVTRGLPGGGFVYTNKDSLSIGLVVNISALRDWKSDFAFAELLEEFKQRPEVEPLLAGGETVEYGAHLIPEGGRDFMPRPGKPGLLLAGDAAGLVINTGNILRGMDLALASGVLAGRSLVTCLQQGDEGQDCLARYEKALAESFVGKQMKAHRKAHRVLSRKRLYEKYPALLSGWISTLFEVDEKGEHPRFKDGFRKLRRAVGYSGLRDLWKIMRM